MGNALMDGISVRLNETFGDGYRVYADRSIEQGLVKPAFFIALLHSSQQQMIGTRYRATCTFDVHYFPQTPDDHTEMNAVAAQLFDALEVIRLLDGDLLRGRQMRQETIDGVLHFFVTYTMFPRKVIIQQPMEAMTMTTGVTEEDGHGNKTEGGKETGGTDGGGAGNTGADGG